METILRYFEDSFQFTAVAEVVKSGSDENGCYVTLTETIFYPQGGGQPYDIGTINENLPISSVKWVEGEVRHYTSQAPASLVGQPAFLVIDKERRIANSRLHTAGHLLAHVVETLYPHLKAVKGHHYMDGAYVEFIGHAAQPVDLERVTDELNDSIAKDLAVASHNSKPLRLVAIGHFPPQACGGTHVQSLSALGKVTATKKKLKGTTLRISYVI